MGRWRLEPLNHHECGIGVDEVDQMQPLSSDTGKSERGQGSLRTAPAARQVKDRTPVAGVLDQRPVLLCGGAHITAKF